MRNDVRCRRARWAIAGKPARSAANAGCPPRHGRASRRTKLTSLKQRLLANGWLTSKQITAQLGIGRTTIGRRRTEGRIKARICNDGGEWLYWPPERPLDEHAVDADVSAAATGDNPTARGAL